MYTICESLYSVAVQNLLNQILLTSRKFNFRKRCQLSISLSPPFILYFLKLLFRKIQRVTETGQMEIKKIKLEREREREIWHSS